MNNKIATRVGRLTSLVRVVQGFAEGTLVALGLALVILLVGTPLALLVRGVRESLSWFVRMRGETSVLMEAFVSMMSVVVGFALFALLAALLVVFFDWRHRLRARAS